VRFPRVLSLAGEHRCGRRFTTPLRASVVSALARNGRFLPAESEMTRATSDTPVALRKTYALTMKRTRDAVEPRPTHLASRERYGATPARDAFALCVAPTLHFGSRANPESSTARFRLRAMPLLALACSCVRHPLARACGCRRLADCSTLRDFGDDADRSDIAGAMQHNTSSGRTRELSSPRRRDEAPSREHRLLCRIALCLDLLSYQAVRPCEERVAS
jgi:hypothetical protein